MELLTVRMNGSLNSYLCLLLRPFSSCWVAMYNFNKIVFASSDYILFWHVEMLSKHPVII